MAGKLVTAQFRDFSGGLNLRDAPIMLAPNETPDCLNVQFDERGGVVARKGLTKDNATDTIGSGSDNIVNGFYSAVLGYEVFQVGAELWARTAADTYSEVTRAASANAFTTSARCSFADFAGNLVMVHPVDGILVYSGSSNITVASATPVGTCCAVWQNKLWVASGNQVSWSNAGTAATWTGTDTLRLRDLNDAGVTALVPMGGALVAFKRRSMHRIYDSTLGANTIVSADLGVVGPLAVTVLGELIYGFSEKGVIVTDGLSEPRIVSDKIEPMFHPSQVAMGQLDRICAGQFEDRALFSFPGFGETYNDRTIEVDTSTGAWGVHDFGASCFVVSLASARLVLVAAPGSGSGVRHVYKVFDGTTDDGTAIASRWRSAPLDLGGMGLVRVRRALLAGRGDPDLYVYRDFASGGEQFAIDFVQDGVATWGSFKWGDGTKWGSGSAHEVYDDAYSLGTCRAIQLELRASGSTVLSVPQLLSGLGQAETIGAWAFYGATLDYVPLGRMAWAS